MFQLVKVLVLSLTVSSAFAGQLGIQSVSDISSMQLRADGEYNVVCKNGSFEVVSSADVANNNVCPFVAAPPPPPPVLVLDGTYRDPQGALCDQKSKFTYEAGVLKHIRLDFPGCGGDFMDAQCSNNVCESMVMGYPIVVTALDSTHYSWVDGTRLTTFERIGDLNVRTATRAHKSDSRTPGK